MKPLRRGVDTTAAVAEVGVGGRERGRVAAAADRVAVREAARAVARVWVVAKAEVAVEAARVAPSRVWVVGREALTVKAAVQALVKHRAVLATVLARLPLAPPVALVAPVRVAAAKVVDLPLSRWAARAVQVKAVPAALAQAQEAKAAEKAAVKEAVLVAREAPEVRAAQVRAKAAAEKATKAVAPEALLLPPTPYLVLALVLALARAQAVAQLLPPTLPPVAPDQAAPHPQQV